MAKQCSIDSCTKQAHARTWCISHYSRWRLHGDPNNPGAHRVFKAPKAAFEGRVRRPNGEAGCWEWDGAHVKGYAVFGGMGLESTKVHRYAYEQANGPIRPSVVIDHICGNHGCVNPAHLREASKKQNAEHLPNPRKNASPWGRGVYLRNGRFRAVVGHQKRLIHVGSFDTAAEAAEAARRARIELFTHNDEDRILTA